MTKTNKINFYKIKSGLDENSVFKDPVDELQSLPIKDGYQLYYNPKMTVPAPWVDKFFKTEFKAGPADRQYHVFNAASSQAVLLRTISLAGTDHTFAICFGTGFHMLSKDAYEPRFGLISVLNLVSEDSLRRIDKHDISGTPKFTAEQLSKQGSQMDFGLDIELDILLGVTGSLSKTDKREKRLKSIFGTTLSGRANLNLNAKFDIDNIDRLLKASVCAFNSSRYERKGFDWIDKIDLIKKGTDQKDRLDAALSEKLAEEDGHDGFWLAVPELVDWQDIAGFYFNNDDDRLFEDITFDAFADYVDDPITLDLLKSTQVSAKHPAGDYASYNWSCFQCLYAEIELDGSSYILINGEWYRLKDDFVALTNQKYQGILDNHTSDIAFPNYEAIDKNENGYNQKLTDQIDGAVCLDAKNIVHGGGYGRIEFCDVFDVESNKLIHVKKYSGSSVLSHLFAQGYVSSELAANDLTFRQKVEEKIADLTGDQFQFGEPLGEFEVVFAVIAKPQKTEIPFFSKVNLNNTFRRIQNMRGFSASLAFIENHAPLEVQVDD